MINRKEKKGLGSIINICLTIAGILGTLCSIYISAGSEIGMTVAINKEYYNNESYLSNKLIVSIDSENQLDVRRSDYIPQLHLKMPFQYMHNDIKRMTIYFPDFNGGIKKVNLNRPNLGFEDVHFTIQNSTQKKDVAFLLKIDGDQEIKRITENKNQEILFNRLSLEQCARRGDFYLGIYPSYKGFERTVYFDYFVIQIDTTFGTYSYLMLMFVPSTYDSGVFDYIQVYDINQQYDSIEFRKFCEAYQSYAEDHEPVKALLNTEREYKREENVLTINDFIIFNDNKLELYDDEINHVEMTINELLQNIK